MEETTNVIETAETVIENLPESKGSKAGAVGILGLAAAGMAAVGYGIYRLGKKIVCKVKAKKGKASETEEVSDVEVETSTEE